MKKVVPTLTTVTALVVAWVMGAPSAMAMVPPEPAGYSTSTSSSTALWGLSWTSLVTLLIVAAVVAIAAVVITRMARHTRSPHASAA